MIFGMFGKKPSGAAQNDDSTVFENTHAEPVKATKTVKRAVGDAELLRQQRGCLFEVVRECMIASGVLSSAYKFKVLSADATHQQFMVLFDLSHELHTDTHRLSDMEQLIRVTAQRRYELQIKACFWRIEPAPTHPSTLPASQTTPTPTPEPAAEDTRAQAKAQLAELFANSPDLADARPSEFAATEFSPDATAQQGKTTSYVLLTGYEDTELAQSQFKPTQIDERK
jgi:hypothetical protein